MGLANIASIVRQVVFTVVILLSLACAAVSAHFLWYTEFYLGGMFFFTPLAIAVGVVSAVTLILLSIMDLATRGRFFSSKILAEWIIIGFLFCAWMGTAGYAQSTNNQALGRICSRTRVPILWQKLCHEMPGIVATAFLSAFILFFYLILTIVVVVTSPAGAITKSLRQLAAGTSDAAVHDHSKQPFVAYPPYGMMQPQMGYGYNSNYPDANQAAQYPYPVAPMQYPMMQQPPLAATPPATAQNPPGSINTYTSDSQAHLNAQPGYPNYQGPTPPAGDTKSYPSYQASTPPNADSQQAGYPNYQGPTPPQPVAQPAAAGAQPM